MQIDSSTVAPHHPREVAGVAESSIKKVPSGRGNSSVPRFAPAILPGLCYCIPDAYTMLLSPKERYFGLKGGWLVFWITVACATDMTLFGYDQVNKGS